MTRLNWEADRRRKQAKEYASDDLPPTGSWADQARYFGQPYIPRGTYQPQARQPSVTHIANRKFEFEQLGLYVSHATHPDFRRKSQPQRAEVVQIIRKLLRQCECWGAAVSHSDQLTIQAARRLTGSIQH
jgi:hypothetical protein